MISKRGLVTAGALGLGTALLATTSAYACVIGDFTVGSSVACDTTGSAPHGVVTVTNDDNMTGATVTVALDSTPDTAVATQHIGAKGESDATINVDVPWTKGASYTVHIHSDKFNLNQDSSTHPQTPQSDCAAATQTPPPVTSTPTTPVLQTPPPNSPPQTPTATPSVAATSAPVPSASQSTAGASLAETGGGSNSGTMIGIAAALVVVGGGALMVVRRKAAANRH